MARGRSISRSASSGRFVSRSATARWPSRTTTERVGGTSGNTRAVSRSAATGRFVKTATAQRHPESTITQWVQLVAGASRRPTTPQRRTQRVPAHPS